MEEIRRKWKIAFWIFIAATLFLNLMTKAFSAVHLVQDAFFLAFWIVVYQMAYVRKGTKWLMSALVILLLASANSLLITFLPYFMTVPFEKLSALTLMMSFLQIGSAFFLFLRSLDFYAYNRKEKGENIEESELRITKIWKVSLWLYLIPALFLIFRLFPHAKAHPVTFLLFSTLILLPVISYFGWKQKSAAFLILGTLFLNALSLYSVIFQGFIYVQANLFLLLILSSIFYAVQSYRMLGLVKVKKIS